MLNKHSMSTSMKRNCAKFTCHLSVPDNQDFHLRRSKRMLVRLHGVLLRAGKSGFVFKIAVSPLDAQLCTQHLSLHGGLQTLALFGGQGRMETGRGVETPWPRAESRLRRAGKWTCESHTAWKAPVAMSLGSRLLTQGDISCSLHPASTPGVS